MEVLVILGILIIFLLVFGLSFLPILAGILWLMGGMAILSTVFFVVMAVLTLAARKKEAVFCGVEKVERYGEHAVYEIEGQERSNLFPTDALTKRLLYRKEKVSVRALKIGKNVLVFDRISQVIIAIGLPTFAGISWIILDMIR